MPRYDRDTYDFDRPRARNRRKPLRLPGMWWFVAGIPISLLALSFLAPGRHTGVIMVAVVMMLGLLAFAVGQVWLLVLAAIGDSLQLLLCLFVPFYILYFTVSNLEWTWRPACVSLLGFLLDLLSLGAIELHGAIADWRGPEQAEQAPPGAVPPKPDARNGPSVAATRPFDVDPNAKAAGKTVYLSALTPFAYKAGPWRLGIGVKGEDEKAPLEFQNQVYKHGISMHPPQKDQGTCRVSFVPGKEFKHLKGWVGIGDYTIGPRGAVVFAATGDGRKLWESEPLARNKASIGFDIDVTGVEVLTLVTGLHDGDYTYCNAIWLDPWLER
jgi:hypothetical protein